MPYAVSHSYRPTGPSDPRFSHQRTSKLSEQPRIRSTSKTLTAARRIEVFTSKTPHAFSDSKQRCKGHRPSSTTMSPFQPTRDRKLSSARWMRWKSHRLLRFLEPEISSQAPACFSQITRQPTVRQTPFPLVPWLPLLPHPPGAEKRVQRRAASLPQ